ncbi:uncharacterized protein LOC119341555 isoform X2 [Triticum dicoccoides]|uniref:uncharacterized protein LOC119341555 isoform X2 n=1 Tax=Triticum dicoccoides TaxID=85692 RepID=UPI000E7CD08D|nr:uncharacterized protein LOC119341555 isoform X2 [Triticum dicoccoides]
MTGRGATTRYLTAADNGDELNSSIVVGKYHRHLQSTPPTKSYGKGTGAAFAKELGYFNTGKHVSQMKDRKRATNPVNHQPKRRKVCQNISEEKHLDMDDSKLDLKFCTGSRQKKNFVEPKDLSHKLQREDLTFGSSTKRWYHSKNQTYQYERLNTGNENKELVFFSDEDTKLAKSVDVKVANKRQIDDSKQGKEKVTIKKEQGEGGLEKEEAREH